MVAELKAKLALTQGAIRREARLARYLSQIAAGMFEQLVVVDRQLRITDLNDRAAQDYGGLRTELIGKACYEVTHKVSVPCSSADHQCPVREVFSSGLPARAEHVHRDAMGQELFVEIHAFPLMGDDGRVEQVVEVHHNVTSARRAEAERIEREKLQAVVNMAGAICHELNQPLQVVQMCSSMLADERKEDGGQLAQLIQGIVESTQRMADITHRLATITSYETTEYVLGRSIVDLQRSSSCPPRPDETAESGR